MIQVFQVQLTDAMADEVNAAGNWGAVAWGKTYMTLTASFGDEPVPAGVIRDGVARGLITLTRLIDTDDLETAFAIGNGMGDDSKQTVFKPSKSISVGDILVLNDSEAFMVVSFGFTQLAEEELSAVMLSVLQGV